LHTFLNENHSHNETHSHLRTAPICASVKVISIQIISPRAPVPKLSAKLRSTRPQAGVSTHYHGNPLKPFGAHYTTKIDASQEK